ncbi:hypothetical protein [Kribbella sp. NPDC023855]|uniref:hypothetical protein n=1 Tax=Kribbella sp. NPDC023855 TaxID=3154698 RepID=UPI0034084F9E
MSTNPIPPVPPAGGGDPDNPDPDSRQPDIGIRPDDDSPLTEPVPEPEPNTEEDPDDQLPRW